MGEIEGERERERERGGRERERGGRDYRRTCLERGKRGERERLQVYMSGEREEEREREREITGVHVGV